MVTVLAYSRGNEKELIVKGHATGSTEICAAVSGIVYALAGWMQNNEEHLKHKPEPYIDLREGDASIYFRGDQCAAAAFDVAYIGLAQIAQTHPEFVTIETKFF